MATSSTRVLSELERLAVAQQRCFDGFRRYADAQALALWDEVQADASHERIEALLGVAWRISASARVEPALAELWFEFNSQHLDGMQRVERYLVDALLARCQASIAEARADLDNHRQLSRRLAQLDDSSAAPLLFNLAASRLYGAASDSHSPAILDLLNEQGRYLHEMRAEVQETRQALAERKLLDKAKGQLMQRLDVPEDQAHRHLQQLAMRSGRSLGDVARQVLEQDAPDADPDVRR